MRRPGARTLRRAQMPSVVVRLLWEARARPSQPAGSVCYRPHSTPSRSHLAVSFFQNSTVVVRAVRPNCEHAKCSSQHPQLPHA